MENSSSDGNTRPLYKAASCETCIQVKKQQLELNVEQQDWFQIRKGVRQGCMLSHPAYLTLQTTP